MEKVGNILEEYLKKSKYCLQFPRSFSNELFISQNPTPCRYGMNILWLARHSYLIYLYQEEVVQDRMFTDQHHGAVIKESQAPQVSDQELQSPGTMKVSPGGCSEVSKVFSVLLSSTAFIDGSWKTVAIPHKHLRHFVCFPPSRIVTMAYLHVERRVFHLFLRPKSEVFLDNFPSFPPLVQ